MDNVQDLSLDDLSCIDKIFKGILPELELKNLERCDQMIESLGMDRDRAVYFMMSREMIPQSEQQKCSQTLSVTTDRLSYTLPKNVCGIKSLRVMKLDESARIKMLDPGKYDCEYYGIDYGWVKHYPEYIDPNDKQLVLLIVNDVHEP